MPKPRKPLRKAPRASKEAPSKARKRHRSVRSFKMGEGCPPIPNMQAELQDMWDVLLGRAEPPIDAGPMTLMEVADAYYARGMELTSLIHQAEREGTITRGSSMVRFRTGELRDFCEVAKRAADLGSRRLTYESLMFDKSRYGRESYGDS